MDDETDTTDMEALHRHSTLVVRATDWVQACEKADVETISPTMRLAYKEELTKLAARITRLADRL